MSTEGKRIVLKSSDNETFEIEEKFAIECQTIKHMMDDDCAEAEIPLPNVNSKTLAMVIEYCKKIFYYSNSNDVELKKKFEAKFVKVDKDSLFDLCLAANYLNIKSLLDLTCQEVADRIKNKQPEEVRKFFNITTDYTPEQEAQVLKDNAWAFE